MALITTLVLCARSRDLVMSVSVRRVHVVLSTLLDLRAEESRVVRHVKPPSLLLTIVFSNGSLGPRRDLAGKRVVQSFWPSAEQHRLGKLK